MSNSFRRTVWTAALVILVVAVAVGRQSLQAQEGGHGAGDDHTVLILDRSVTGGIESAEASLAVGLGFSVEVATDAEWGAKTQAQFATYRAIILGDPKDSFGTNCSTDVSLISAAVANKSVWGPAVTGNVVVVGTDPISGAHEGDPLHATGRALTQNGINFAAGAPTTGLYVSLSCFYFSAELNTPVDVLSPFGSFLVVGGETNDAHIVDSAHPVFTTPNAITDATLADWGSSIHESFTGWPSTFSRLATSISTGRPYILASTSAQPSRTSETQPPDPDTRQQFDAGGTNQTLKFTFNNLNTTQPVVLEVTEANSLTNHSLLATATLYDQAELDAVLATSLQFPPDTHCLTTPTSFGPKCVVTSLTDPATNQPPSDTVHLGAVGWSLLAFDNSNNKANLPTNVAFGMAHLKGMTTTMPENIILSFDEGVGTSDSYSAIWLTTSPYASAPILFGVPSNRTAVAAGSGGAVVTYSNPTAMGVRAAAFPFLPIFGSLDSAQIQCLPASGSTFPLGTTHVNCTATGDNNVHTTRSFDVTVGCCDVKLTVSPTVASRGQTVWLTVSLSNLSNRIQIGRIAFDLTTPCTHEFMGSVPVLLLPRRNVSFTVPFKIPLHACLGAYTFTTTDTFSDGSTTHHSTTLTVQ